MKKIDMHCHVNAFPQYSTTRPNGAAFLSAEEQIEVHDKCEVKLGVMQTLTSPEALLTSLSNEGAQYVVDKYPGRFTWFCNVDPRQGKNNPQSDLGFIINQYKEKGAKGLGELTANLYVDDPMMENLFRSCAELDMPVMVHLALACGRGYGIVDELGLPRIEKMLKKYPDLKLIGHSTCFWSELSADVTNETRGNYMEKGKIREGRVAELMREYGNLYCDLSAGSGSRAMMCDPEYTAKFLTEFSDRIFYGSDVTAVGQVFQYEFIDFLDKLYQEGSISLDTYEKICYKNAEKLLGVKID